MFTQRHVTNLFVSTQPFTHTRTVLVIKYTSACLFGCDSNSRTHLSPHLLLHATDRISSHDSSRLGSHPPLTKNRRIFQEFSKESRVSNLYPLEAALQLGTGAKVGALRPSSHYPTKPAIHEGGKKEKGWSRLQKKLYICTMYWYHHSSHLLGPCFWSWVSMSGPKSHCQLFFQQCSQIWSATWRWVKECNNP